MTRLPCAVLLLALSAQAHAAEPAPAQTASPVPDGTGPATVAPPDSQVSGKDTASDEAAATRKANERFNPSEKISEDLSVSFPADI